MTLTTLTCYCSRCNRYSHQYGVEHDGEPVYMPERRCRECGSTDGLDPIVVCGECGERLRESAALRNDDEDRYYCGSCRSACSICGQAFDEELMSVDEDGNLWCIDCEIKKRNHLF